MAVSSAVTYIITIRQGSRAIRRGLQALLCDRMRQSCQYFRKRGYATVEDKREFEYMYQCYHELGRNGVMTKLYEEVLAMDEGGERI